MEQRDYPYSNFKVATEKTRREVLTISEIELLEKLDLGDDQQSYRDVRNMFLFAFYTGLRISDVIRLDRSYVRTVDQGYMLDFNTFKAKKRAQLPLYNLFPVQDQPSKPEQLLDHYLDQGFEKVFPSYSEPFINRHLKGLASLAGIRKKLTFHLARHSFGTYMASRIPLPTLQKLMQHSDIKTTMVYVNMNLEMVNDDLSKTRWD